MANNLKPSDPQFQYMQGHFSYYVLHDLNGAKQSLIPAAEKGYSHAQYVLGLVYEEERSYRLAVKYFRLAAWQGLLPEAQFKLGCFYYYGQGVERDIDEAVKWLRLGAEGGDADAEYSLAQLHLYGQGVPRDDVEAYKWFTLALTDRAGKIPEVVREIEESLAGLRQSMPPGQVAKAEKLAAKLGARIARQRRRKPRPQRKKKGEKIYLGTQEVMGSIMEWSVDYAVQPLGDEWILFVSREEGGWDRQGPTGAEGLVEALEMHGLSLRQFIANLRSNSTPQLNMLAQEMERYGQE